MDISIVIQVRTIKGTKASVHTTLVRMIQFASHQMATFVIVNDLVFITELRTNLELNKVFHDAATSKIVSNE